MTDQWHIDSWNEDVYRHYKKRWMKGITMKFAILLDIDGDIMYLPNQWPCETGHNDPKLFDTIEEAEAERKNWNTGMIVDYFDDAIRPMNPEERKASLLRGLKNNGRK
jgi:hypothetical protein|tara:strand:- start:205 stop:528 length:324 start_codon:yes stop_codon:yes gene_type:complete